MSTSPPPIPQQNQQPSVVHHSPPVWPAPNKKRPLWIRVFFWGVGAPMLALFWIGVIGAMIDSKPKPSPVASKAPITSEVSEPPHLSVTGYWQAYEDNEVNADLMFKGKLLKITGTVVEVSTTMFDSAVVHLRGDERSQRATAHALDSAKADLASLRKGQTVTLRCNGGGKVLGEPVLASCVMQ